MLNIDDHTATMRVSHYGSSRAARASDPSRRDIQVFAAAEQAYVDVGLVQHTGKKTRGSTHQIVVGAEIEGRIGTVSAPWVRTAALIRLTLIQILLGRSTLPILQSLVGSWTSIFLFRRPLLSVFTKSYVFLSSISDYAPDSSFDVPLLILEELLTCVLLAPFAATNFKGSRCRPRLRNGRLVHRWRDCSQCSPQGCFQGALSTIRAWWLAYAPLQCSRIVLDFDWSAPAVGGRWV